MKVHKILCAAVVQCVFQIISYQKSTAKTVSIKTRSNKAWGKRDRTFIGDTTFAIIRNLKKYAAPYPIEHFDQEEKCYHLIASYLTDLEVEIPDWMLPNVEIEQQAIRQNLKSAAADLSTQYSYPAWLLQEIMAIEGQDIETILNSLHTDAPVYLRCNTLNVTREDLQSELLSHKIETEQVGQHGLLVKGSKRLTHLSSYQSGWFEIQDLGSQQITEFLDPQPGDVVLDVCAGAGGKTLHMAMLMENEGQISASDIEEHKLQELIIRANRNRVFNLEVVLLESTEDILEVDQKVDKILLDVPCSGTGVIRRKPETKYNLTAGRLQELQEIQRALLSQYASALAPGGVMVYATCSLLPSENEVQIKEFLAKHPDYICKEQKTLYPHEYGGDGFFMAKLVRQ